MPTVNASTACKRVLAVDDEPAICELLREALTSAGISVDTACSAQEAMQLYRDHQYDLITLDCFMPGIGGVELHHALSNLYGFGQRLSPLLPQRLPPVLLITGYSRHRALQDLIFAERVVGVLQKPVAPRQLAMLVRDILGWEDARAARRAKALGRLEGHLLSVN
jgi:CheY-like chemotaxis protein